MHPIGHLRPFKLVALRFDPAFRRRTISADIAMPPIQLIALGSGLPIEPKHPGRPITLGKMRELGVNQLD
jgi:hypothetical protein